MRWSSGHIWQPLLLTAAAASVASAGRSLRHVGKSDDLLNGFGARSPLYDNVFLENDGDPIEKRAPAAQFLNSNTSSMLYLALFFLLIYLHGKRKNHLPLTVFNRLCCQWDRHSGR